jgi:ABC-2 type transport system permease protein
VSVTTQYSAGGRRGLLSASAFGDDLRRFWNLTVTLASTEFKLKYFGSALGYVWSLMRPVMLFGVLYLVFTQALNVGNEVKFYAPYLLTSIVLWTFFAEATSGSVQSLIMRESLLRKMRFPRLVVPLSVTLTAAFNLATNLCAVVLFAVLSGVRPHVLWLEIPLLLVLLAVLATGLSMLLSSLYVRYRDIQPIWEVLAQALFYASAVLYVVGSLPEGAQRYLLFNPLAAIFTQMRHAFLDPDAPTTAQVMGGRVWLLIPLAIIAALFLLGLWVFNREAPRIAERL